MPLAPLCSALLVRNEASRYLGEVLDRCAEFGGLVVLDDNSDDGTFELCRSHPATLACFRRSVVEPAWGREAPARKMLWELATQYAEWVLIADADQLLDGDPRDLIKTRNLNAWAFPLYDLWNDRQSYREDGFWRAHCHPRPWLFNPHRVPPGYVPEWATRGIHCGHFPTNFPLRCGKAPDGFRWRHLSYVREGDRKAKLLQYRSQSAQLTEGERAHAESIGDRFPRLLLLDRSMKICIGGPVRKPVAVLEAHLQSLAWQELPQGVEVTYCFAPDYPQPDVGEKMLEAFVKERGGVVLNTPRSPAGDFSDTHPQTHQWSGAAMQRVGQLKQAIFNWALQAGCEFVWLVDADVICDRTTLSSLLYARRSVTTGVYWTIWQRNPERPLHAGPQVWLAPPYVLAKPHYPEHEFRRKLTNKEMVQVGGLGACTLIHKSVIVKGAGFHKPPGFPTGGLWDGEDRHFCEWCRRLHIELWADGWPDIFHIYHQDQLPRIPEFLARLGRPHPPSPLVGDDVSLLLESLEDGAGITHWRGRLNQNALLVELADAVQTMKRGDRRIVRVHYPDDCEVDMLRGQSRLIQVTLADCKPAGLPPVLEEEFHVAPSGLVADATLYTEEQNGMLAHA